MKPCVCCGRETYHKVNVFAVCASCDFDGFFADWQRRRTPHALDGRDSAPSLAVSSPEVLSPLQTVSSPALPQVM